MRVESAEERRARTDEVMRQIEDLGFGTPEYHDAVAFLLTIMAKRQWIIADSIRRSRADSERRRTRAAKTRARRAAEAARDGEASS